MAGYSGTPLWKKLGLKPGGRLLLTAAPAGWGVGELPEGVAVEELPESGAVDELPESVAVIERPGGVPRSELRGAAGDGLDVTIAFFGARAELAARIEALAGLIFPDGALWIAWPRRAAGHESDLREQDIRDLALPLGIVDVKVAALDEDWSGLRLVWRKELRRA
jgi:hypothetical protein